jgi:hypothetical protein
MTSRCAPQASRHLRQRPRRAPPHPTPTWSLAGTSASAPSAAAATPARRRGSQVSGLGSVRVGRRAPLCGLAVALQRVSGGEGEVVPGSQTFFFTLEARAARKNKASGQFRGRRARSGSVGRRMTRFGRCRAYSPMSRRCRASYSDGKADSSGGDDGGEVEGGCRRRRRGCKGVIGVAGEVPASSVVFGVEGGVGLIASTIGPPQTHILLWVSAATVRCGGDGEGLSIVPDPMGDGDGDGEVGGGPQGPAARSTAAARW